MNEEYISVADYGMFKAPRPAHEYRGVIYMYVDERGGTRGILYPQGEPEPVVPPRLKLVQKWKVRLVEGRPIITD